MSRSDIDKLKGNFYIYSNGEYVVLLDTKVWIYKTDGSLVACRKDLRYAGRITFLSGNRMLLCSSKAVFHMIDLRDGSDLWTAPYTKIELNAAPVAISPNEAFAYTFDQWKGNHFISRLDLQTQEVDIYDMYMDVGATSGIICDEEGIPYLLKSHQETIGGQMINQCGVRIHNFFDIAPGNTFTWKSKWSFPGGKSAFRFFDSTDRIITTDLQIYTPSTGTSYDLLEKESSWQRPEKGLCDCWFDTSHRYLCLMYRTVNVVIDIYARKVVAQYAADHKQGCLIGSEYWICVGDGIQRKPFPALEDAPPVKTVLEWDSLYAKHPELW